MPLFVLQALLDRVVAHIASQRPEIFERMGEKAKCAILIDPVDMPFVLLLRPNPAAPEMRVLRRSRVVAHDASIAGSFLALVRLIDTQLDGDALFFSRDLRIGGDVEAVVGLRNAMDDVDGSIAADIAALHGPLGIAALGLLRRHQRSMANAA
ncbi:MAG: ubiquinone anaerobic biosynthesis accessory factor UbiT [Devosia sp.]